MNSHTPLQSVVLSQLRLRRCPMLAHSASEAWEKHQTAFIEDRVKCPGWLRRLFDQANVEALVAGVESEQLNLMEWKPGDRPSIPRKKPTLPPSHEWKIVSIRETARAESAVCVNPNDALRYWKKHIATAPHFTPENECCAVLILNVKSRIRGHQLVSIGSACETMAQPREVFRAAVIAGGYAIVLMHNHPSGDPAPSEADRSMTKRFMESSRILCVHLNDHVIVGRRKYFSFREAGLFP